MVEYSFKGFSNVDLFVMGADHHRRVDGQQELLDIRGEQIDYRRNDEEECHRHVP